MLVSDVIEYLSFGELYNHAIFSEDLNEKDTKRLIFLINEGLKILGNKFNLFKYKFKLHTNLNTTKYTITDANATTDVNLVDSVKYVLLEESISLKDVLSTLYSLDDVCIQQYLNRYNVIELPIGMLGNVYTVQFKGNHKKLVSVDDTIEISRIYLAALCAYVSHKIYASGTSQESMNASAILYQRFELLCEDILHTGVGGIVEY